MNLYRQSNSFPDVLLLYWLKASSHPDSKVLRVQVLSVRSYYELNANRPTSFPGLERAQHVCSVIAFGPPRSH